MPNNSKWVYLNEDRENLLEEARNRWPSLSDSQLLFHALRAVLAQAQAGKPTPLDNEGEEQGPRERFRSFYARHA
ncbi:MAG: hypothetical protein ACOC7S_00730 [Planctomycetota bacterium]